MPILPILLLAAGVALYLSRVTDINVTSSNEGTSVASTIPLEFDVDISDSLGWPYFYSRGAPSTPWSDGPKGVDCSGYALMLQVRLGIIKSTCPDMAVDFGVDSIANNCDIIPTGEQRPGDFAYYPGHIMTVATDPDLDGHSGVIGASGGTRITLGNNPKAYVKTFETAAYRGVGGVDDFKCYMRWKPDFKYLAV